ncbi:MAG: YncE family protein [Acetobacteraceae bacterium]|nr:YncE family protein [Acetobacteraceae bacterium]
MFKRELLAMCFTTALMLATAMAGPNDILIGLDQKVTYGPEGSVNGAPGKDEVLVLDIANPAKPVIRARLPLMNSLLGPPTNLQITPDGKLGLVANSVLNTPDANGYKVSPDDRLFVIDLTEQPPKLVNTVTVGKQPSGLAISRKGDLVLIANRNGKSVSVLTIAGGKVSPAGEVQFEQEAAAVAITPDGKRAFVCLNVVNRVAVLNIDGQKVTYDKAMDIPVSFNPYNIDVTPNGKFVIVSTTGAGKNNADAMAVIEAAGPRPHVVDLMTPGTGPEGFAISPDGKWVAAALLLGSGAKPSDWFKTKTGELVLMSLDSNSGEMTVQSRAKVGGLPEGVAFSPKSDYIYVGNYFDSDLQVFRTGGGRLSQIGPNLKLGGQPASMRALAR